MQLQKEQQRAARRLSRRGSATVEFAIVAPLFLALALGAAQNTFNIDSAHSMYAAIRQGGRLASQDANGILQTGQTLNDKVILDIRNQLKAEGMPTDQMTISITDPATNAPFDLSNVNNDLKLFRIKVEVPYTAMNSLGTFKTSSFQKFSASIVFRKGKNSLVR